MASTHTGSKGRSFSVIQDTSTKRVIVVQNKKTGKWMLPGGLIDRNDGKMNHISTARNAVARELLEESGFKIDSCYFTHLNPHTPNLQTFYTRNDILGLGGKDKIPAYIFCVGFNFGKIEHKRRVRIFQSRKDSHETSDYGFADISPNGIISVQNYNGTQKVSFPTKFRRGTLEHLKMMLS